MSSRTCDNNGRPIVRLAGSERAGFYLPLAVILAVLGWIGLELVSMRDAVKAQGILQGKDHEQLVDHEDRIRYLEGHPTTTRFRSFP
jgi:hypothetical protein